MTAALTRTTGTRRRTARVCALGSLAVAVTIGLGCAAGLPAVESSDARHVSVAYDPEAGLASTSKLAHAECGEYDAVPLLESDDGEVARFECEPVTHVNEWNLRGDRGVWNLDVRDR